MKKIIIIATIVVVVVVVGGIIFLLKAQPEGVVKNATSDGLPIAGSSTTTPTPTPSNPSALSQATLVLGDATVSGANISSTLPADAPQGASIQFQVASGTISVKNFYKGAQGYWPDLDAILIHYSEAYSLWYYRGNSGFVIVLPEDGEDQAAAEAALTSDLGVDQQTFCSLPITVEYVFDRGGSNEDLPLISCMQQAL